MHNIAQKISSSMPPGSPINDHNPPWMLLKKELFSTFGVPRLRGPGEKPTVTFARDPITLKQWRG
jgi:hypothetical protein